MSLSYYKYGNIGNAAALCISGRTRTWLRTDSESITRVINQNAHGAHKSLSVLGGWRHPTLNVNFMQICLYSGTSYTLTQYYLHTDTQTHCYVICEHVRKRAYCTAKMREHKKP